MEKAVLINRIEDLEKAAEAGYERLYFGQEFCELKIPTAEEVKRALDFAATNGLAFTLVTPYVTDAGLAAVERALTGLPVDGTTEVVVNDYGTLRMILAEKGRYIPVIGRLLSKQKRGLGISTKRGDAGPALTDHWRASAFDTSAVRSYLDNLGVARVELDNLKQGISSDFSDSPIRGSLYYPYGYVTTTRYCPWVYDGVNWTNLKGRCGRPCQKGMIEETGDVFDRTVFISGNAQFYKNEDLPFEKELLRKGINRIVYENNIPG